MASGTWGDPNVYTKVETDNAIQQYAAVDVIYSTTAISSNFSLSTNIRNYRNLIIILMVDPSGSSGNSVRKSTLCIPVSDIINGGFNSNNQYIASINELSGGSWYHAFLQFYFSTDTAIKVEGSGISGWNGTLFVKVIGEK